MLWKLTLEKLQNFTSKMGQIDLFTFLFILRFDIETQLLKTSWFRHSKLVLLQRYLTFVLNIFCQVYTCVQLTGNCLSATRFSTDFTYYKSQVFLLHSVSAAAWWTLGFVALNALKKIIYFCNMKIYQFFFKGFCKKTDVTLSIQIDTKACAANIQKSIEIREYNFR